MITKINVRMPLHPDPRAQKVVPVHVVYVVLKEMITAEVDLVIVRNRVVAPHVPIKKVEAQVETLPKLEKTVVFEMPPIEVLKAQEMPVGLWLEVQPYHKQQKQKKWKVK